MKAKRTAQWGKAARWTAACLLALWGFVSFLVLVGEENPCSPMPLGRFCLLKVAAMVSLLLCWHVGKCLHRTGYLPKELDEDDGI